MTPNNVSYLDHYQGNFDDEPLAIGGYTTVEEIYNFDPIPSELNETEMKHVIGFQGNVWTEYMPSPAQVEYMILPRMCAISETAWRGADKKDFAGFTKTLEVELKRLNYMGATTAKITTNKDFKKLSHEAGYWYRGKDKSKDDKPLNPHKK
jgi:hexosaminidase